MIITIKEQGWLKWYYESKTDNYCDIKLLIFNMPGVSRTFNFQCLFELI